jgi:hypothetical protein
LADARDGFRSKRRQGHRVRTVLARRIPELS